MREWNWGIALFSCAFSLILCSGARAQVLDSHVIPSLEVGGGWNRDPSLQATRSRGSLWLGAEHEWTPSVVVGAAYLLTAGEAFPLEQAGMVTVRYQFNVLAIVPWVGMAGGGLWSRNQYDWVLGPEMGLDWRREGGGVWGIRGRYLYPDLWIFGVSFGYRIILGDPFDQ